MTLSRYSLPPSPFPLPLDILTSTPLSFEFILLGLLFQIHVSRGLKLTLVGLARGISFLLRRNPRLQSAGASALARTDTARERRVEYLLRHPLRTNDRRRLRRRIRPSPRQRTQRRRKVVRLALRGGRDGTGRLELYFGACLLRGSLR